MSTTFWIQFLGVIFGVGMMYFTFVKFKRKELTRIELSVWMIGWVLLVIVAIIPFALDPIIHPLNFYRRLDFFVVLGFFVLLGMGFFNYSTVKKLERKVEVFVRNEAHREVQETQKPISNVIHEQTPDEQDKIPDKIQETRL